MDRQCEGGTLQSCSHLPLAYPVLARRLADHGTESNNTERGESFYFKNIKKERIVKDSSGVVLSRVWVTVTGGVRRPSVRGYTPRPWSPGVRTVIIIAIQHYPLNFNKSKMYQ